MSENKKTWLFCGHCSAPLGTFEGVALHPILLLCLQCVAEEDLARKDRLAMDVEETAEEKVE